MLSKSLSQTQKWANRIPGMAYLVRLILCVLIYWSLNTQRPDLAWLFHTLDAVVDWEAVQPLIHELRTCFLAECQRLRKSISETHFDIRISRRQLRCVSWWPPEDYTPVRVSDDCDERARPR